jgi:hypothetical protein
LHRLSQFLPLSSSPIFSPHSRLEITIENVMARVPVGLALRDRLGDNGVRDLEIYIEQHEENRRTDVVNQITERLDFRMNECASGTR